MEAQVALPQQLAYAGGAFDNPLSGYNPPAHNLPWAGFWQLLPAHQQPHPSVRQSASGPGSLQGPGGSGPLAQSPRSGTTRALASPSPTRPLPQPAPQQQPSPYRGNLHQHHTAYHASEGPGTYASPGGTPPWLSAQAQQHSLALTQLMTAMQHTPQTSPRTLPQGAYPHTPGFSPVAMHGMALGPLPAPEQSPAGAAAGTLLAEQQQHLALMIDRVVSDHLTRQALKHQAQQQPQQVGTAPGPADPRRVQPASAAAVQLSQLNAGVALSSAVKGSFPALPWTASGCLVDSGSGQGGTQYSQSQAEDESQEAVVKGWHNECDTNNMEGVYATWGQEEELQDAQWQAKQQSMRAQLFDLEASIAIRCAQHNSASYPTAQHNKGAGAGSSAGSSRSTFDRRPAGGAEQTGSSSKEQAAARAREVVTVEEINLTASAVQSYFRDAVRVESEIAGVGGFGDVYVTRRLLPGLGFPVAVKKLRLLKNNPEENLRRRLLFASEADMLLRVAGHPSIVRCLGFCAGSCPEDWEYHDQQQGGDDADDDDTQEQGYRRGMPGASTSTTQSFEPLGLPRLGSRRVMPGTRSPVTPAPLKGQGGGRGGCPAPSKSRKRSREHTGGDAYGSQGYEDDQPPSKRSRQKPQLSQHNKPGTAAAGQLSAKSQAQGRRLAQAGTRAGAGRRAEVPPNLPCCIAMDYAGPYTLWHTLLFEPGTRLRTGHTTPHLCWMQAAAIYFQVLDAVDWLHWRHPAPPDDSTHRPGAGAGAPRGDRRGHHSQQRLEVSRGVCDSDPEDADGPCFVVHRDLSPLNICIIWPVTSSAAGTDRPSPISLPRVRIFDFGLSKARPLASSKDSGGLPDAHRASGAGMGSGHGCDDSWCTPGDVVGPCLHFLDPAVRTHAMYGRATDIYACGMLLLLLLYGEDVGRKALNPLPACEAQVEKIFKETHEEREEYRASLLAHLMAQGNGSPPGSPSGGATHCHSHGYPGSPGLGFGQHLTGAAAHAGGAGGSPAASKPAVGGGHLRGVYPPHHGWPEDLGSGHAESTPPPPDSLPEYPLHPRWSASSRISTAPPSSPGGQGRTASHLPLSPNLRGGAAPPHSRGQHHGGHDEDEEGEGGGGPGTPCPANLLATLLRQAWQCTHQDPALRPTSTSLLSELAGVRRRLPKPLAALLPTPSQLRAGTWQPPPI